MIKKIKEREKTYESLVSGAQALTQRVATHGVSASFDNLVAEHNRLLGEYIAGYNSLSREEREDASRLLSQTKQYIHGSLDVLRIREMQTASEKLLKERK
ncbi:hypothetical protein J4408_01265 [Candidatus Pacearchaeota archaeon]|nr:hypothetical protein [Candidatus Pacearchaeota archaeon]